MSYRKRSLPQKLTESIPTCHTRYLNNHTAIRKQTEHRFKYIRGRISKESFGRREFANVRQSDAKAFFVHLHETGLSYGTILNFQMVLKPAFEMAIQDNYLRANPFAFKLSSVIKNDAKEKFSLTQEQIDFLLAFVKADKVRAKHYDKIVILMETGLRISELTHEFTHFAETLAYTNRDLYKLLGQTPHLSRKKARKSLEIL